jgi:signal transduction histidine kinase
MRWPRSVGARLALALLLIVAGALGIVYLIVVPSLKNRLVDGRISELERAALSLRAEYDRKSPDLEADILGQASSTADARIVRFTPLASTPPTLSVAADSRQSSRSSADIAGDPLALKAAITRKPQQGTVSRGGDQFAEAAVWDPRLSSVLLLSAPLKGPLGDVSLVQRRLLLAGALALLVALLVGYTAARLFARRIRRLEQAAERIADGHFDESVVDTGSDELGELARAFERMRERLAQLDRARREFVANASHELRTPLFALGGFLELLRDEEVDETTQGEFIESMHEQVERLTKLAADLLDLTRLDAGRLRVDHEPVELATLAESLASEFAAIARSSDHPLTVEDGQATAFGDEDRVRQIGRILLENALVHTPPGTAVRLRVVSENGQARLEIEDDAGAIPSTQAAQLFERFYRLDGTRASGSGLGLAIARELAELMGGRIEFRSEPNRTVFVVVLPVGVRPAEPAPV